MDTQSRVWARDTATVLSVRLAAPLVSHEHYVEPTNSANVRITVLGVHSSVEQNEVMATLEHECERARSDRSDRWILVDCFDENGAWLSRVTWPGTRTSVAA